MAKAKTKTAASPAESTYILVATQQLVGTITLNAGDELTAAKATELGLDDATVADLVERGSLERVTARVAASVDGAALAAAIARAETAEAKVVELTAELADVNAALAEATKPAEPAA